MNIHFKKTKRSDFQNIGSVKALQVSTRSGVLNIIEGEHGIEITPLEVGSRLCIVPASREDAVEGDIAIEVLTLYHGYEIMHESESDGG